MPTITLQAPYEINSLAISPAKLLNVYFFGIEQIVTKGQRLSDEVLSFYIKSAQEEIEEFLSIKLRKQVVFETQDFNRNLWQQWGFVQTKYPVNKALELKGFYNSVLQITYPSEWLSAKQGSDGLYYRQLHVVPNGSDVAFQNNAVVHTGLTPHLGFAYYDNIPNYWHIVYCTGFDKTPNDIVNIIGKLASINIFHLLGDLILGAGIASQSIGIDGLSQSISTTSSATNAGYGSRIQGYLADLKQALPRLKAKYKGYSIVNL